MITEDMAWPPHKGFMQHKVKEHAVWYSGDPNLIANFYYQELHNNILNLPYSVDRDIFWARQIQNDAEVGLHVPIAGDIAETSANLLFGEPPIIKIAQAHEENASKSYIDTQKTMDKMFMENGTYTRFMECAEVCAALGGGFIKLAWDEELSPYPIPVVEQIDNTIAKFKFGILTEAKFWEVVKVESTKYWRLIETYDNDGDISYELYKGTEDKLGKLVDIDSIPETEGLNDMQTGIGEILAVYVPNQYPNRYNRNSYMGRSDYAGIEGLMDHLDGTYSAWMRDIVLAQAKILAPQQFLEQSDTGFRYNVDKMIFAKLDMDPTTEGNKITAVQFAIRAEEFEKTSMALIERAITSAGYSPQTFGLNIQGRAESGTALNIRERKSFATKAKKEVYWEPQIKKLSKLQLILYNKMLKGTVETDVDITTQFSDSISTDTVEVSQTVLNIANAMAASTETKVRLLHPDWSEDEVKGETDRIIAENNIGELVNVEDLGGGVGF